MKRIVCILMMLLFAIPAFAAENPFAPFTLTVPEAVTLENNGGTYAFVSGTTRVVTMVIERVPDADPTEAVLRMMGQFEPDAVLAEELTLAEGYAGLTASAADKFGEGVDQWNVLILSGCDLEGDEEKVHILLDALLAALTVDGAPIVIK